MKKNIVALLFGLFITFIFLEIFLRIYDPFQFRVKAGKIVLPANRKYIIENNHIGRLDKKIVHTKNSLGFRGEEIPQNFENYLSIIVVGGSSTECFYLSDDKTWPYLLGQKLKNSYKNVWLNNAGLDGHSTFGHIVLLKDHLIKIKPKIILFLVGRNDVARDDLNRSDKRMFQGYHENVFISLLKRSEVVMLFVNLKRVVMARRRNLAHYGIDIKDIKEFSILKIPEEVQRMEIQKHKSKYIENYKKRFLQLVELSKLNGIEPIFITQPTLWGKGIDNLTGVNLETVKLSESINGKLYWDVLELYNNVTKEVGEETDTFVIDSANKLTKNSLYFYDDVHFTSEGAEEISEILYVELKKYLDTHCKSFIAK